MASWIRLVLLLVLAACGGEETAGTDPDVGTPDGGTNPLDPCAEIPWNYENVGAPFMLTWCTSCHHSDLAVGMRANAPAGIDLDTYAHVVARSDRIIARALGDAPTMPPAGGPTPQELENLKTWLECGAPE